ncbi:MAG: hypothetical protein K8I82_03885 [Anaerolineae bacterium]|nr:hypothetical protein [Anaerolineae bacterium]
MDAIETDNSMQIAGKRLMLRDIQAEDRPALIHWLHPDHEWHKTNGPYYPKAQVEEIPDIVDNWITAEPPNLRQRMLAINNETDQIIGMVNRY